MVLSNVESLLYPGVIRFPLPGRCLSWAAARPAGAVAVRDPVELRAISEALQAAPRSRLPVPFGHTERLAACRVFRYDRKFR